MAALTARSTSSGDLDGPLGADGAGPLDGGDGDAPAPAPAASSVGDGGRECTAIPSIESATTSWLREAVGPPSRSNRRMCPDSRVSPSGACLLYTSDAADE